MATMVRVELELDLTDAEDFQPFSLYERIGGVGWVFVTGNQAASLEDVQAEVQSELVAEFPENQGPV